MPKKSDHNLYLLIVSLLISAQIIAFTSIEAQSVMAQDMIFPRSHWDYHNGDWTLCKLGFPIKTQLSIGEYWSYVFNLDDDTKYHIYLHGEWIDNSTKRVDNRTDYDVFVFGPSGDSYSNHTESAGLVEHLGTSVEEPIFRTGEGGAYTIVVMNDPKESEGSEPGTLMVIEHLDVNRMYQDKLYMEGKDPITGKPRYYTTWVYEFNTSNRHIEVPIEVPDTLDMYEVRLYLVANPELGLGEDVLGMPIAWDPGLYGEYEQGVGGFNINSSGCRGIAFDSCEYPGEDMLINYTSQYTGNLLYHLVFIAESGYGYTSFMIKTDFNKPFLDVSMPSEVYAEEEAVFTAIANDSESGIESIILSYSIDAGKNWKTTEMIQNEAQVYIGEIPGQPAGTTVLYRVEAWDSAGNKALEEGSYQTKYPSRITISPSSSEIIGSESVSVEGSIDPPIENTTVLIQYIDPYKRSVNRTLKTSSLGNFSDIYTPYMDGVWEILASWEGDQEHFAASNRTSLTVERAVQTIYIKSAKNSISLGEYIEVYGSLTPPLPEAVINLIFTDPRGNMTIRNIETSLQGEYSFQFKPDSEGSWTVKAVFPGDALHESASSQTQTFEVKGGFLEWPNILIIPLAAAIIIVVLAAIRRRGMQGYEGY